MNKGLYLLLGVVFGAAAGSGVTYVIAKKKFEAKLNTRFQEMEEYSDLVKGYSDEDDVPFDEDMPDMEMYKPEESEDDKARALSEIKKKIKKNEEGIQKLKDSPVVQYNKAYKGDIPEEEASRENIYNETKQRLSELREAEDIEEEDLEQTAIDEDIRERESNKDRAPRIISGETASDLGPIWEHTTWVYYTDNDVATDEDENVVEDYQRFLGDCLDKYDFRNSDEDVIFVQNFEYDTVYEVIKVRDEYISE